MSSDSITPFTTADVPATLNALGNENLLLLKALCDAKMESRALVQALSNCTCEQAEASHSTASSVRSIRTVDAAVIIRQITAEMRALWKLNAPENTIRQYLTDDRYSYDIRHSILHNFIDIVMSGSRTMSSGMEEFVINEIHKQRKQFNDSIVSTNNNSKH